MLVFSVSIAADAPWAAVVIASASPPSILFLRRAAATALPIALSAVPAAFKFLITRFPLALCAAVSLVRVFPRSLLSFARTGGVTAAAVACWSSSAIVSRRQLTLSKPVRAVCVHPAAGSHASSVQESWSSQSGAVPATQTFWPQVSTPLHALWSSQRQSGAVQCACPGPSTAQLLFTFVLPVSHDGGA